MKKLNIFRAFLDFYWFVSIFFVLGLLVVVTRDLFNDDLNNTIQIRGLKINNHSDISKVVVLANLVGSFVFLYGIYLLRKVFILFQKKEVFTLTAINCFRKIGNCIITSAVISQGSIMFYKEFEQNAVGNSINGYGFDTFVFAVFSGIIFKVVSEIFKIAKQQKEENDLTI